jgi:hypothetical protein
MMWPAIYTQKVGMIKLDIEIYGVLPSVAGTHRAEIELESAPDIVKLLKALVLKIPELSCTVIDRENNMLMSGYMFNIDGRYCSGIENEKLTGKEHIVLLALASDG